MKPKFSTLIMMLILLSVGMASGCKTAVVTPVPSSSASAKLEKGCRIFITTPTDGSYGATQYPGSGSTVVNSFIGAFSKFADEVLTGGYEASNASALQTAKAKNCDYVAIPIITHWEDRATEWSGVRDKMELFVKIIRVKDSVEVAAAEIGGKSRWATFGGDHPQDLVKQPVEAFVASIF